LLQSEQQIKHLAAWLFNVENTFIASLCTLEAEQPNFGGCGSSIIQRRISRRRTTGFRHVFTVYLITIILFADIIMTNHEIIQYHRGFDKN
jgi:hypothetical protein